MSDIKRYGVWDKPPREDLVTYADHEAAIEQAYSDGESSGAADWQLKIIEVIERHDTGGIMSPDAEGIMGDLRALTQPQTEKLGSCVEHGTWDIYECEYGQCPQCGDKLVPTDTEGEAA